MLKPRSFKLLCTILAPIIVFLLLVQYKYISLRRIDKFLAFSLNNLIIPDKFKQPIFIKTSQTSDSDTVCKEPFVNTSDEFSVVIDGVKYPQYVPLFYNKSINFECLNKNTHRKRILYWTWFAGRSDFGYGVGFGKPLLNHNCPVFNCEFTSDRNLLNSSDVVIFHILDHVDKLPPYKFDFQNWIFYMLEAPFSMRDFSLYNNIFDMTATYRFDANIHVGYHQSFHNWWTENNEFDVNENFHAKKKRFAAAIISNCNDNSQRLWYLNKLNEHMPMKIYGKCGSPCPDDAGDCRHYIASKYKFFFAFENSICQDYITEKFFVTLNFNIVPVVMGGGVYERFIPKSGFINAKDFKGPKELADYLLYLDSNATAYNSYFKWRRFIKKNENYVGEGTMCELCILLNLKRYIPIKTEPIKFMNRYWSDERQCKHDYH